MSGYGDRSGYPDQGDGFWGEQQQQPQGSYNFDMSGNNFGQELNFQSFDASQPTEQPYAGAPMYSSNPYLDPSGGQSTYHGDIFTPAPGSAPQGFGGSSTDFEDEPPLLEVDYCREKPFRVQMALSKKSAGPSGG